MIIYYKTFNRIIIATKHIITLNSQLSTAFQISTVFRIKTTNNYQQNLLIITNP